MTERRHIAHPKTHPSTPPSATFKHSIAAFQFAAFHTAYDHKTDIKQQEQR